jgi:hypothetical protein
MNWIARTDELIVPNNIAEPKEEGGDDDGDEGLR